MKHAGHVAPVLGETGNAKQIFVRKPQGEKHGETQIRSTI
jgi:hypothetical protein